MSDSVSDREKVCDKLRLAVDKWYQETNLRALRRVTAKEYRFLQKGSLLMLRPEAFREYRATGGRDKAIPVSDEIGPIVVVSGPKFLNPPSKEVLLNQMIEAVNTTRTYHNFRPAIPSQCWHNVTFHALNKLFKKLDNRCAPMWRDINRVCEGDPTAALNYVHSFYGVTLLGSSTPIDLYMQIGWDPGWVFRKLRTARVK